MCTLSAQAGPLKIAPARHFQFTPQPGTAWYLDGTTDGANWSVVAGPFFPTGSGAAVDHFQPAGEKKEFRLRYVNPATIGPAPVVLSETSLAMGKSGKLVEVVFISATRGFLRLDETHAGSFIYTWTKTAPDEGEAILTGRDGSLRLLRLKFKDGQVGQWGMEEIPYREAAARITQTLDGGDFSFYDGRFRRNPDTARLPGSLTGRSMVFNEGERLTYLKFTGDETLTVTTPKGGTVAATYSYDPETEKAGALHIDFPGVGPIGFRLNLDGPGRGKFTDIPADAGQPASRSGTFTTPEEQEPQPNPNCPPTSIAGSTYLVRDSATVILTFLTDGSGYSSREENGVVKVVGFYYHYKSTGAGTAKVSLVFPGGTGDAVDDYEMTWSDDCTGKFKRESFVNGNKDSVNSTSGDFTPTGGAAGFGGGPPPGLGM